MNDVTKPKQRGPAAIDVVAATLQLLQSMSNVPGCPPAIALVCSVALQVIQVAQTAQQNKESCDELTEKISQIMVVVLMPYAEQPTPDVPISMQKNIERLHRDLVYISRELQEALGKNIIKSLLLSSYYRLRIAGCSTKLDWAINVFKVDALLQQSISINRIEGKLDRLTLQQANSSALPMPGMSNQLFGLPPKPEIFYGREEAIEEIVGRLLSTPNGRFFIGGPGGLGKTSVALTGVHDPRIVAKFRDHRYWVPCDRVTSASSLIRLLAESLKISTSSTSLLEQVIALLGRDAAPKLVLLDNFETPWDVEDQRLDVETILKHLVSVRSVTLLLTVRSESPPCKAIKWTQPPLGPLDTLTSNAARRLYTEYDSGAASDPSLDTLLSELSYMPLAVTLMAARGASGESPQKLLTKWRSLGTATLGHSGTRLESVQISVRLSTESQTMANNPQALKLLSLLTLLPAGAPKDLLDDMALDIDASGAFHILQKVSLAYLDSKSKCVSLLSPIKQFVTEAHPPTEEQLDAVFKVYRDLLLAAGDKMHSNNSRIPIHQALAAHFPNVEAISLRRLEAPNPDDAVDIAVRICDWRDSPMELRLIQAASKAAGRVADPFLQARCTFELAATTVWTDRRNAIGMMEDALAAFRSLDDQQWALRCLSFIAQWLYASSMYEKAASYAGRAADLAKILDDDEEYANSFEVLARIAMSQERLGDALAKMEQVYQIQQRTIQAKGNLSVIGTLLIYTGLLRRCKRFGEAHEKLGMASALIQELADGTYEEGWRQSELADLYRDQGQIDDALAAYTASAVEDRKGGFVEDALWRQTDVGDMLIRQRRYDDAKAEFQRTLEEARGIGLQEVVDYCRQSLEGIKSHLHPGSSNSEEKRPAINRPRDPRSPTR